MSAPRKHIMEPGFASEWLNFTASLPRRCLAGVSLGLALVTGGLCPVAGEEATAILEAGFGKAEIDLKSPRMTSLWLRQPDGRLTAKSLLAADPGGCTYLVGWTSPADARGDRRFESSTSRAHRGRVTRGADNTVSKVVLEGILPAEDAPAVEDWEIALSPNGAELVWKVIRTWRRPFQVRVSGTPALFLGPFGGEGGYDPKRPAVTSTLWYEPGRILGETHPRWPEGMYRCPTAQTLADRDTWAVYKLFSNFHCQADLRLAANGGYLYRRGGNTAAFNEVGSIALPSLAYRGGTRETVTLTLKPVDKLATGYQLNVDLPDKRMQAALRDLYGSVFNGGMICDQKNYDFGNESEGYKYIGGLWFRAFTLAAGDPAPDAVSAHPYSAGQALRQHAGNILAKFDPARGVVTGYGFADGFLDNNINTIIGVHTYLLHTGDIGFVRDNLAKLEGLLQTVIAAVDPKNGLFKYPGEGSHWYYDCVNFSGFNTYYSVFLYKALCDLGEMERLCGWPEPAVRYLATAEKLRTAINTVLWKEDAPGGPRYIDWINLQGREHLYFIDLVQYPAIVFGVASPEQARKILATADARLAVLEREHGYTGCATLSALWPIPVLNTERFRTGEEGTYWPFGHYMNGGSLLAETYWEVVARAKTGDAAGAYRRLRRFAEKWGTGGWFGRNGALISGEVGGGNGEVYLADLVVTSASLVNGILGIRPTWDKLDVEPCLPSGWDSATATVIYKGVRHTVAIRNGEATVTPKDRVYDFSSSSPALKSSGKR
jgi:hypothetical protein